MMPGNGSGVSAVQPHWTIFVATALATTRTVAVIVDASVALKWVIEEDGSTAARRLIEDEELVAPDLIFIECANALWAKVRRNQIARSDAMAAFAAIEAAPVSSVPSRAHAASAQAIAFELEQTAYDSLYLAVTLAERSKLVTADEVFARAALAHPVYRDSVRLL
jgi:predicted nucleic acid-binding protein